MVDHEEAAGFQIDAQLLLALAPGACRWSLAVLGDAADHPSAADT
jgi:hypothetical protein